MTLQHPPLQILGSGPDLSVLVDSRTAGVYTCLASVRGFPELRGDVRLLVKGPPTIVSAGEQEGRRGDTVSLECRTLSIPSPIKVTWTHKGREIDLSKLESTANIERRTVRIWGIGDTKLGR